MHTPRAIRRSLIAAAVACCFGPSVVYANPVGPTVTHGQASFAQEGKQLTVTNSPGSIIHWQGFSIAAGETTRFAQQSAASAVLNRVIGGDPSSILGALQSNGRVFLINPNGIIFGAGAQIDTAGLVASALNIMDADFLMGRMRFVDTPGAQSVSNAGEIRTPAGGRVLLIAPQDVENSGIIHSPQGEVILAAGKSVEIADSANPEVRVEIAAPEARAINLGEIVAASGKVGIYGGIVSNRGLVSADSAVVGENGKIVFRASHAASLDAGSVTTASGAQGGTIEVSSEGTTLVAGTVKATGSAEAGGEVRVLGEQVGLIDDASIDVSGAQGGGTVLVGGDLQGANPAVHNAQMTYAGSDTNINADAVSEGDGGKVIVWADDTTRSHGSISARGGALGGDGGFVETSGKKNLEVTRGPDVRAPSGNGGTWLIDPNNIDIVAGSVFDATTNTGAPFFSPLVDGSVIGANLINAQLNFGSNVVINTTSRGATAGTDLGNITLSAPIVKSAATVADGPVIGTTTLTLQAHNDIVVNPGGSITSTGDRLNVTLTANVDNAGGGAVTLGGPITTNGGSVNIQGRDLVAINAPIHTLNANGIGGGSVNLTSTANMVNTASTITSGSNVFASGLTGVTVSGPVTGNFFSGNSANGPVVIDSTFTTSFGMNLNGFGITVGPSAVINTGTGSFIATDTSPATLNVQAGASITSSGATLTSDNMEILGTLNAGAGSVILRQNTFNRPMFLGANDPSGVALASAELDNISTTGSTFIGNSSTGAITVNGPLTIGTAAQISVTSGSTFTQNAGATVTSNTPIAVSAPTGITLNAPSSATMFTFTTNSFAPNQTVTSSSDIDVRTFNFGTAVNLGVGMPGAGTLDLTSAQIDNLITAPAGVLRIGTTSSGPVTVLGPIAPAGTQTLKVASSSSITQAAGATITETNLALQVGNGNVNLPEANAVGTLAASQCCAGNSFTFKNGAANPLTIGTVDFISGVSNFNSDPSTVANIDANNLTIAAPFSFVSGTVAIRPVTIANKVDLGGADAAGVLGLSPTDVGNVFAGTLLIKADQADISMPIVPGASTLQIVPITAARNLNIVAGPKNAANLEFVQGDINNVTVGTFKLGDAMTGPVNVASALVVPNTIGTFGLQSGDTTTGLTVNQALSATNSVSLFGDVMSLNALVSSSSGNLLVANSSAGRVIDLGTRTAGKLGLSESEIETKLSAAIGTINFGSSTAGNLDVTAPLDITGAAALESGGVMTVATAQRVATTRDLTMRAPRITLDGNISSSTGNATLVADRMDIRAAVSTPAGDISVVPLNFRSINIGTDDTASVLGFTQAELDQFMPLGPLLIGDVINPGNIGNITNTANIVVTAAVAPSNTTTLSLVTDNGTVTQTTGSTITVSNLAVRADGNITLDQNNDTDTVAARSNFGDISITYFGTNPLNIGTVDGLVGVQAFDGDVTLRSDELNINQRVDAGFGSGDVTLISLNVNRPLDIGGKPGGALGLNQAEFNLIGADTLTLGNVSAGNGTVSAPVNITGGVNNLSITTSPSAAVAVNNALTVPGDITIDTGTLTTAAALTSSLHEINLTADAMTFGAMVSSGDGYISLQPQTAGTLIAIGGNDAVGPPATLGLDSTDLGNLSFGAGTLSIGNTAAGDMSVTFAGMLPGSVSLATGGLATFSSNTFSASDTLSITADTMTIPGMAGISAPNGIDITTATPGRNIILGTRGGPAGNFELDAAELNKISSGMGTLAFDTSGSLTTTAPLAFTLVQNAEFSAGTINHTGGALSAPGEITFFANSMPSAGFSTVTSTGGGRVTFAPRDLRSLNLGTNPAGAALGVVQTQIDQISTSGVVQLGNQVDTNAVTITAPIAQPAGSSALTIASIGSISQSSGSTITASNLNLQTFSSVNLPENNVVGNFAGSSFGSFSFTSTGTLTIGTVDGMAGISDSTVTLRSDGLNVVNAINGGTTTLTPRVAGTAINLGGGTGYAITDAAVDLISGFTLNIGDATAGPINVTSTVDRAFGNLNLMTAPGNVITVGAPLGSATTNSVTMNSGLGGTVNIDGAVQASNAINVTGQNIAVNAPVTSNFSSVTLGAATGDAGSVVSVNQPVTARNQIRVTADAQNFTAPLATTGAFSSVLLETRSAGVPIDVGAGTTSGALNITAGELALISTERLTIGNTASGPLTITSAIGPFTYDFLSLQSGGDVTQLPGAIITVSNTDPVTGVVTGSLNVVSGGTITLAEANNVAVSVSGTAAGTANNFVFNNIGPFKLQNVTGVFATGKVLLMAPPAGLVLGSGGALGSAQEALPDIISAFQQAQNVQETANESANARKEEGDKAEEEKQEKEGTKSCS